jgi:uncharacterized protein (DUF1697 family)
MTVYIALIRGINVGGNKLLKMADVKAAFEKLGLQNVRTHLQSGNVVFQTDAKDRAKLGKALEGALGVEAKIMLRTAAELRKAIAANPLPDATSQPSRFIVAFLSAKPTAAAMKALRDGYSGPETMELHGAELYIQYGDDMGRSKLNNALLERKLGVSATSRNWNTVTRLLEMADEIA